ncbi:RagB/SusD family nutrient uptake outer membrane protein [Muricauda sp. HICW]|uniref:RagB/SusD family nutrient uptake outer membrane protein n=1 Tax=Flagellimonas chongwuensis TaxID=2697365 RepID=A0A850NP06_9FLAO|nr:RagB/SusD family nutrient uptake outer membrane protein [Allomuricauda chongwuensis]NVN19067.1 RagB/SusD family nutrient uptake outer membrane protein [Allomuricauda chongwuensis]
MKRRTYYLFKLKGLAPLILIFLLTGCSEDILDVKPLNGYSELDVFEDAALLQNYVNGSYRALRTPLRDENTFTDGLTDNAYNQHGSAEGQIRRYTRGEVDRENGEEITFGLWSHCYSYIRNANLFFEKIEGSSIPAEELDIMEGEMRFLRAYNYFELFKYYGGVPLISETFELGQESYEVTRGTIDETVDFILNDIDLAISLLPSKSELPAGKASMEAAMALKGRLLLYAASPLYNANGDQEKWEVARDANKAVMDLTSVTLADFGNWESMFLGNTDEEVIFRRQYTPKNDQGWGVNTWLFPNGKSGWSNTTPTQDLVDSFELVSGELPSESATYDPQDPYVDRDPRFYETIVYNTAPFQDATYDPYVDKDDPSNSELAGIDSRVSPASPHNASRTGYTFKKWANDNLAWDAGNTGPYIFYRKTEAYLNYAEAQIELNNESEARNAINAIRNRAGMPDISTSGQALLEDYRNERRVEFVLEDHRFFDIRRWMIGPETMGSPKMGVDVLKTGDATFEYDYDLTADSNIFWDDKMYMLPIPFSEIQRSNNSLDQNPGY